MTRGAETLQETTTECILGKLSGFSCATPSGYRKTDQSETSFTVSTGLYRRVLSEGAMFDVSVTGHCYQ